MPTKIRQMRRKNNTAQKPQKGRINTIRDREHWDIVHSKLEGRLLLVQFSSAYNASCKRMLGFMTDLSRATNLSHIVFASLDVDEPETTQIAEEAGIKILPTIKAYKDGAEVETVTGGNPGAILEMVQRHAGARPESSIEKKSVNGRVVAAIGAVAVALLAGVMGARRLRAGRTDFDSEEEEIYDFE